MFFFNWRKIWTNCCCSNHELIDEREIKYVIQVFLCTVILVRSLSEATAGAFFRATCTFCLSSSRVFLQLDITLFRGPFQKTQRRWRYRTIFIRYETIIKRTEKRLLKTQLCRTISWQCASRMMYVSLIKLCSPFSE